MAEMDDVRRFLKNIPEDAIRAVSALGEKLAEVGIDISHCKSIAKPPPGEIVTELGITSVDVATTSDEYVEDPAMKAVRIGELRSWRKFCFARVIDKVAAHPVPGTPNRVHEESGADALSRCACKMLVNGGQRAFEVVLEIAGVVEGGAFFGVGGPSESLELRPHQQAQTCLPPGAEGIGLRRSVLRDMSASLGSRICTLLVVIAGLQDLLGEAIKETSPSTKTVRRITESTREVHQGTSVTVEKYD